MRPHPHLYCVSPLSKERGGSVRPGRATVCIWLVIGVLSGGLMIQTLADPHLEAFQAISKAYASCDTASQARSVEGTLAIDTADYRVVGPSGKTLYTNGPKLKARYKQTYAGATQVRQHTDLQKVELKQGIAVATILQHLELSAMDSKINNWRTLVIDWQMEDRWVSTSRGWKRKQTKVLKQSHSERVGPVQ